METEIDGRSNAKNAKFVRPEGANKFDAFLCEPKGQKYNNKNKN